jgi:nicotinamide-nucleotide adenylyltransferase
VPTTTLAWCSRPPSPALLAALDDGDLIVLDQPTPARWARARAAARREGHDGHDGRAFRHVVPYVHHGLTLGERALALRTRFAPELARVVVDDPARAAAVRRAGFAVDLVGDPEGDPERDPERDRAHEPDDAMLGPDDASAPAALVIFRAQPLHEGHVALVRRAFALRAVVVIVVAAADRGFTVHEPFTAGERLLLLRRWLTTLPEADRARCWLAPLPTPPEPALALPLACAVVPRVDVIVARNPGLLAMARAAGLAVEVPLTVAAVVDGQRVPVTGTRIRDRLVAGDDVDDLVPPAVRPWLATHGAERLRTLGRAEHGEGSR